MELLKKDLEKLYKMTRDEYALIDHNSFHNRPLKSEISAHIHQMIMYLDHSFLDKLKEFHSIIKDDVFVSKIRTIRQHLEIIYNFRNNIKFGYFVSQVDEIMKTKKSAEDRITTLRILENAKIKTLNKMAELV